ncbi:SPOR domain-containing protein [Sphingomonas sp. BGYR3]|uniref:SPOR domain-containing protein n=1 Tax=Sphingomonas sp. BGYR3 TaxID=2975483 RepID=UPI0021A36860|nr:SPOR domain-containing protein [Sphingomonas sp. BGYR3]MDG5489223.1 SPOR domain-containing protein [Sphingomonas sp. BGYR3]
MNAKFLMAATLLTAGIGSPALADVKAGLEAWARGDYAAAVGEWRADAERGDADAQFNLGQAYRLGRGVPQDLVQAEEWYRRAALQNHVQASDFYGLALFQNGKKRDAVRWLEASAARGEPRAQYVLGTLYFNGDVTTRDHARAFALLTRASAQGITQATQTLEQIDRYIALPDRQRGAQLASDYERQAAAAPATTAAVPIIAGRAPTPDAPVTATANPADLPSDPRFQPKPMVVDRPAPATPPAPKPVRVAAPAIRDGGWRVQLGAFGDPGNARRLWTQVQGRFPGRQPSFVRVGKLTRLIVGPFASQADAKSGCARVSPCVPVPK